MSRSTNASEGTPDDDEGRLGDDPGGLTGEAGENREVDDESDDLADTDDLDDSDEVSDAVDQGDAEPDDDQPDDETEPDKNDTSSDKKAVAASAPSASGAKRSAARGDGKAAAKRPAPGPVTKKDERRGPIAAIVLFVRQVIAELRKVVTPTSKELGTYSAVVIVFVLIVMAYVGVIDFAVGKLVLWAFGG